MENENLIKAREIVKRIELLKNKPWRFCSRCRTERDFLEIYGRFAIPMEIGDLSSSGMAGHTCKEYENQLKQDLAKITVGCGKQFQPFLKSGSGVYMPCIPEELCPCCKEIKEIKEKYGN